MEPIIIIPARLASQRLPNKPLADIGGEPMIVQVWRRACEAQAGRVVVAAAEAEIAEAITQAGGEAVLTDPSLASGSDRVYAALCAVDPEGGAMPPQYDAVLNVQGDLPTLEPQVIRDLVAALADSPADIVTLANEITEDDERTDPNVVKAVISFSDSDPGPDGGQAGGHLIGRALFFTRASAPYGDGPLYHHIGLYGFRRASLERFIHLPESELEKREKLEQLRALEAGMRIDVALVDTVPFGVDTPADLEKARRMLAQRSG